MFNSLFFSQIVVSSAIDMVSGRLAPSVTFLSSITVILGITDLNLGR